MEMKASISTLLIPVPVSNSWYIRCSYYKFLREMALQQVQDTSENEVTMVFPTFSYIFTQDSRRMSALSNCPRAETGPRKPDELVVGVMMKTMAALGEYPCAEIGPCKPDELVVGVMLKTVGNPQEETGNRYPEKLITPHTS